ncbi:Uncharacterised protein [Bordetella pertussis]|nr:Uncharacterised protein [Bordetella pertussis]CFW30907.1 Uncharacterised protein [Bordetella pertussis]
MIGRHQFYLLAIDGAAGVFDGHADRFHARLAVDVRVDPGHVGNEADADDIIGDALGLGG